MAKKKPCEFCENDNWYTEDGQNQHSITVEVYPENNVIGVTSFAPREDGEMDEINVSFEMNYCPVCGRKLEW
jgi:hypothetical protein